MSFFAMVIKNLLRQPVRTSLTVLGISIGITTVVALGVITDSFKTAAADILTAGGADFMVAQKGSADLAFSAVTEADLAAIQSQPGVERATGVLIYISRVGDNAYFPVLGIKPSDMTTNVSGLMAGTFLPERATTQIVLGSRAAGDLGVGVGDSVLIESIPFEVVGIFHSGSTFQDAGGFVALDVVQAAARRPGILTMVYVAVTPGADPSTVAAQIEAAFPKLTAITQLSEYSEVDQGMQIMDSANLAISLLAVGIGAIGVMNTMVMSVFERTREIGILRAVGWRGRRILRMIVGEALLLCLIATVFGLLLGFAAVRAVLLIPTIEAYILPQYTPAIFLRALAIAIGVALVGSAYPALRAVRLTPMEALRHE